MKGQKRIRDYGMQIGKMETGKLNSITDVSGVLVGHITLKKENINTGATAILPHSGNLFREKVTAASYVINGFGKTIGTIQLEELGTIETPIILTNTLSVGSAHQALVEYMLKNNEDIGETTGTVNPVVCECNDGYLNDIRGLHVKSEHVFEAIESASEEFLEGSVGAGTGMVCYGLKGGIGTASRLVKLGADVYTVGVLVMTNFGRKDDLTIGGCKAGQLIHQLGLDKELSSDKGSVIIILATDIPMTHRQLKRVCKRTAAGLGRTGTHFGNGSGDIVIGFTTANKVMHYKEENIIEIKALNENKIDDVFRAAIESTEEAVLNSLVCADTMRGRKDRIIYSLREYIDGIIEHI